VYLAAAEAWQSAPGKAGVNNPPPKGDGIRHQERPSCVGQHEQSTILKMVGLSGQKVQSLRASPTRGSYCTLDPEVPPLATFFARFHGDFLSPSSFPSIQINVGEVCPIAIATAFGVIATKRLDRIAKLYMQLNRIPSLG
jgi:hypothetical protein